MLVEYDGRQHYEIVDGFGGQKEYDRIIKSDNIKNNYAKDNGIKLIRINHKEKDNISDILSSNLIK